MTLTKVASFNKLKQLTNYTPQVNQRDGMRLVIDRVKEVLKS